jgi:hypothetical protein
MLEQNPQPFDETGENVIDENYRCIRIQGGGGVSVFWLAVNN